MILEFYNLLIILSSEMSKDSFLKKINKKKSSLKHQETIVTSLKGEKYIEKIKDSESIIIKLNETYGFVVDEKPDLQVAEILPFLLLSSQDVVHDSKLLETYKITHVLSVGIEISKASQYSTISYKKVDLLDLPECNLLNILEECFEYIEHARFQNKLNKVLVHCNAGYSRAPSVVIAYLMKSCSLTLEKALQMVKIKRNIRPNEGFMSQLKQFEKTLKS